MKILLVSATEAEVLPCIQYLELNWSKSSFSHFEKPPFQLYILITGIGSTMMAFALARFKALENINLVIHTGIAGAYTDQYPLLTLVEVVSETWGDLGAETSNGDLIDSFELNLMDPDRFPYQNGKLLKIRSTPETNLPKVQGLTVNRTSGTSQSIDLLLKKYSCDIESMEGVGLFYAAKVMDIPFISIRCISNRVAPRDKSQWKIHEAIETLNQFIISYLERLIKV